MADNPFGKGKSKGQSSNDSDSSSSGGGGGRRKTITVTGGVYGSETFPPNTECDTCRQTARAVVIEEERFGEKAGQTGVPLCTYHLNKYKEEYSGDPDELEVKRFT